MTRRTLDFYETAPWQVDALVDHLPELSGKIWCTCVGDGSLMRRLGERRPDLTFFTNDIDTKRTADFHGDAVDAMLWSEMQASFGAPDWIVENPPFNEAISIAKIAYEYATCGVVLMTRLSFVEATYQPRSYRPRGPWLSTHPRIKQIALERYSFTGNGKSDSVTTEWLVWAKVPVAHPGGFTSYGYKPLKKDKNHGDV